MIDSMTRDPDRDVPAGHTAEALLDLLSSTLKTCPDVRFAYLFGSVAKGRAHDRSDLDVAVWLESNGDRSSSDLVDRGLEIEVLLERAVSRPVQVVVLNVAPMALQHNVLRHGMLIRGGDATARRRFYLEHAWRYFDLAPARALFARRRLERIAGGTFGGGAGNDPKPAGHD
jgi:uncharacterized protein